MFKLEFVKEIYDNALSSPLVSNVTTYAQILSVFFVMYALIYKYFASKKGTDEEMKFTANHVYYSFFILSLVFTYPYLLDALDFLTIELEKLFMNWSPDAPGYATTSEHFADIVGGEKENLDELGTFDKLIYYVSRIYNYMTHPGVAVMDNFRNIFIAIDTMIFGIALISRAIKMFILRVIGSFAIIASLFESYHGYFSNWVRMYFLNYIYVAFLFVINFFSEYVYYTVREAKLSGIEDEHGYISSLAYITMLFVKVGLYRKSFTFLEKTLSNS